MLINFIVVDLCTTTHVLLLILTIPLFHHLNRETLTNCHKKWLLPLVVGVKVNDITIRSYNLQYRINLICNQRWWWRRRQRRTKTLMKYLFGTHKSSDEYSKRISRWIGHTRKKYIVWSRYYNKRWLKKQHENATKCVLWVFLNTNLTLAFYFWP